MKTTILMLICLTGLAATVTVAASCSKAPGGEVRAALKSSGPVLLCDAAPASAILLDVLNNAKHIMDGLYSEEEIQELKQQHPWAEALLPEPVTARAPALRADLTVQRILVIFKKSKPIYIFFGQEHYDMGSVFSAPDLGEAPLASLEALCQAPE